MKTKLFTLFAACALLLPLAANAQSKSKKYKQFIPKGYVLNAEYKMNDLNKDGISDAVIIVKNTLKSGWEKNAEGKKVDRNRRGIIVLFGNADGTFTKAAQNLSCFESEFEDGGVYFAPEMSISESDNNNLLIKYAHGRYGNWKYTFRYQNGGFYLIGFDQNECRGPITESVTSINYLTKKKQVKTNKMDTSAIIDKYGENLNGYKESFNEKWSNIKVNSLINLTEVENFGELNADLL